VIFARALSLVAWQLYVEAVEEAAKADDDAKGRRSIGEFAHVDVPSVDDAAGVK
jgi:hypothetical protein